MKIFTSFFLQVYVFFTSEQREGCRKKDEVNELARRGFATPPSSFLSLSMILFFLSSFRWGIGG